MADKTIIITARTTAKHRGMEQHRVRYALKKHGIKPKASAGCVNIL